LHWSLFIFFKQNGKAGLFIELALEPTYEIAFQMIGKHLIRYFIASLLLRKPKDELKILSSFLKENIFKYSDEFSEYAQILTQTFTFDNLPSIWAPIAKVIFILNS
jgi:hypothetical protein